MQLPSAVDLPIYRQHWPKRACRVDILTRVRFDFKGVASSKPPGQRRSVQTKLTPTEQVGVQRVRARFQSTGASRFQLQIICNTQLRYRPSPEELQHIAVAACNVAHKNIMVPIGIGVIRHPR